MMKEEDENKKADFAIWAVFVFSMVVLIWGATSCKTRYIPVVEEHTKDSVRVEHRIDTFYQHTYDSVRVQLPCSDSIEIAFIEKWHTDTIREKSQATDTIKVVKFDSVPQIVEVEKIVTENSTFARFCISYFFITLFAAVILAGAYLYFKYRF